jgi:hypothetical protein
MATQLSTPRSKTISSRESSHREPRSIDDDSPQRPSTTFGDPAQPTNTILLEMEAPTAETGGPAQHVKDSSFEPFGLPLSDLGADLEHDWGRNPADRSQPTATTARILYAVPKLHPASLPPLARIVRIGDGMENGDSVRPYTLTVSPPADSTTKPIAPVLELLRTGRRQEPDLDQPEVRR